MISIKFFIPGFTATFVVDRGILRKFLNQPEKSVLSTEKSQLIKNKTIEFMFERDREKTTAVHGMETEIE